MNTNATFKQLVNDSEYTLQEIATMIDTSYLTVKNWTRSPNSKGFRHMPKHALIAAQLCIQLSGDAAPKTPS